MSSKTNPSNKALVSKANKPGRENVVQTSSIKASAPFLAQLANQYMQSQTHRSERLIRRRRGLEIYSIKTHQARNKANSPLGRRCNMKT